MALNDRKRMLSLCEEIEYTFFVSNIQKHAFDTVGNGGRARGLVHVT